MNAPNPGENTDPAIGEKRHLSFQAIGEPGGSSGRTRWGLGRTFQGAGVWYNTVYPNLLPEFVQPHLCLGFTAHVPSLFRKQNSCAKQLAG